MRIIAGEYRGLALASVGKGDAGAHLRPTTDRVRESLFSILSGGRFGDPVTDARVLDLFAGTGALGLEALSRGAASVTFVDDGRKALSLIRENIAKCRSQDATQIVRRDATRLGEGEPHDLIFLDPPYGQELLLPLLEQITAGGIMKSTSTVIAECAKSDVLPASFGGLQLMNQKNYGETSIYLFHFKEKKCVKR